MPVVWMNATRPSDRDLRPPHRSRTVIQGSDLPTRPGWHGSLGRYGMGQIRRECETAYFSRYPLDRDVVRPFLTCFDVTSAFRHQDGRGEIAAFFLKPETFIAELLGLERELLLAYSPYEELQARSIVLHDEVAATYRERLDPLGSLLVTNAPSHASVVEDYRDAAPERPPLILLGRQALDRLRDPDDLRDLFVQHLFRRDLFGLESPLTRDTSFFGRHDIVSELLDRFRSGQNSGLFGLRRIGKTSVLYALDRRSKEGGYGGVSYIDLSNPSLHRGRWWELLEALSRSIAEAMPLKARQKSKILSMGGGYTETNGAQAFRSDIQILRTYKPKHRLLLALDEIENITFDISPAEHWRTDFLPFWQTIRSVHQDTGGEFCFIVAGVNPHLTEAATVGTFDNPLFSTVKVYYVPPFGPTTVRNMVRKLGRYMGLRSEERLFELLAAEYGGHPFLIRQACSHLAKHVTNRPGHLSVKLFEAERRQLRLVLEKNIRQILGVLEKWYPEEYQLISELARGEVDSFVEFARASAEFTQHMEGYGLVREARASPQITIGLVREHLARAAKSSARIEASAEDVDAVHAEISRRRNVIERRLREIIREGLRFRYGPKAAAKALDCLAAPRREVIMRFSYDAMWEETYFKELIVVLKREWDAYQNWFSEDQGTVIQWLEHVDRSRADAHAKLMSEDDLAYLRVCFRKLEERLLPSAK